MAAFMAALYIITFAGDDGPCSCLPLADVIPQANQSVCLPSVVFPSSMSESTTGLDATARTEGEQYWFGFISVLNGPPRIGHCLSSLGHGQNPIP